MAEEPSTNGSQSDPTAAFRELRDNYMDAWAKAMVNFVNSEAYARASGAVLDTCLTASAPLREVMEKTMLQGLQQLSMPSRAEFVGLAERMTNVEMRLDDMDAKLDRIEKLLTPAPSTTVNAKRAPARRDRRKGAK